MCGLGDVEDDEFAAPGDSFFEELEKENERERRERNREEAIETRLQQDELDLRETEASGAAEEGIKAKVYRVEGKPSRAEVEAHMATHVPFRSWCSHCVKGKSKAVGHRAKVHQEEEIPVVSLDYMFMESGTAETELGMPILVVKDRKSGFRAAFVVPRKGKCSHATKRMNKVLDVLGYRRLVLKSDQEPAILQLKEQVKDERTEEIIMEMSPVEDSRSNGEMEKAIQDVQGQIRTMKSSLEMRYGRSVEPSHCCLPWLVIHSASLLNRFAVGMDGCTAHRRLKGKDFKGTLCEFGECVWYMHVGITGKNKLDSRWSDGIWLGHIDESGETIIGTKDGCIKVRSVKRKPVEDRWNYAELEQMQGTPWEPVPGHPEREIKSRVIIQSGSVEDPPTRESEAPVPKRVYIKKRDVEKFGATAGCEGCKAAIRGGGVRPHTEECRARLEKAIKESEGEDNRVTRAYEKQMNGSQNKWKKPRRENNRRLEKKRP